MFVDTDNALGSKRGDVDDGFALAALFKAGVQVDALGSVGGNTDAHEAYANTRALAERFGTNARVLPSPECSDYLVHEGRDLRWLALGPLTHFAEALRKAPHAFAKMPELVIVGGNSRSAGKWPPFWPFEFNLTQDRLATREVFDSSLPLTFLPLDVACRLSKRFSDLEEIKGAEGEWLRHRAKRWFDRGRRWQLRTHLPIWDLVAAMYIVAPTLFATRHTDARMQANTHLDFRRGRRTVQVIHDFDPDRVWRDFIALMNA